jgi:hypothetical protein
MKSLISCFNKEISKTKTHPINKQICSICLSNNKNLTNYPCNTCVTDSWLICNECLHKCRKIDKRCPVCRTNVIEIVIQPELSDFPEVYLNDDVIVKKKCCVIDNFVQNYNDSNISYCELFHFIFHCLSYLIVGILIGMIIPTVICYNNCGQQNTICTIFGFICGIIFCIMIGNFFRSKKEFSDCIRCGISILGAFIFVFTISIRGEFKLDTYSFFWLIIVLPACCFVSQKIEKYF